MKNCALCNNGVWCERCEAKQQGKEGFFLFDSSGNSLYDYCIFCDETLGCIDKRFSFEVFRLDGKGDHFSFSFYIFKFIDLLKQYIQ